MMMNLPCATSLLLITLALVPTACRSRSASQAQGSSTYASNPAYSAPAVEAAAEPSSRAKIASYRGDGYSLSYPTYWSRQSASGALELTVPAKDGTAAVWFRLLDVGQTDPETLFAQFREQFSSVMDAMNGMTAGTIAGMQ